MRAMQFQEADRTALVTKRYKILAENSQSARQLAEFTGQDDRLPEAPQIFAAGRAWPDAGQLFVFSRPLAMVIAAVGLGQKRRSIGHDVSPPRCPT